MTPRQRPDELINVLRGEFITRKEMGSIIPFTDYSATSTIVGWSAYTAKLIYYSVDAQKVFIAYYIAGTSNSATSSFTLPFAVAGSIAMTSPVYVIDNGVGPGTPGLCSASASLATLYKNYNGLGWTNSGTKEAAGEFWYWK